MRKFSFSSLRVRLIILVLLAIIPALGLTLYTGLEQRQIATNQAKDEALRLAHFASNRQRQLIEGAHQFLHILAQLPQVRCCDPTLCSRLFADILKQYPHYLNIGAIGLDGYIFASAIPPPKQINIAYRPYFQRALKTKKFTVGEYQIGHITGKPGVNLGYPVMDDAGKVKAVVYVVLDLTWLNQLTLQVDLPQDSILSLIDSDSTILARYPEPEKWVGKTMPESSIVKTILAKGEGMIETIGADGVQRLYAFTSFGSTVSQAESQAESQAGKVYLSIGIPSSAVFAQVERTLIRNLAFLLFISLLALSAAWFGGDLLVLRRLNPIVSATKRLGAGDLSARTGIVYGKGELSQLALTFDQMAESLEQRESERKQAEEVLRESEERYRSLFENMLEGFAYCKIFFEDGEPQDFIYLDVNSAFEKLTGLKNVVGKKVTQVIPGIRETYPELFEIYGRVALTGRPERFEIYLEPLGAWLSISAYSTEKEHFIAVFDNITERKRSEEELKLSEQRYRNLIDTARDVIFTLSIDGTISSLNPAFDALIGWARSEWVGKSFVPLVHPSDISLAQEMFRGALQGETTPIFELHILTKQSKYIVGEFIAVPQFESGQVVGVLGIARDITERKRAEEALKESEEYLKNLFDSIRAGIIIIDTETHNIIDVNSFALEIIGVSKEQILNRVCHKYICPAELGKCPITDLKQNVDSSERVLIKDNSERIPILKSVVPVIREGRRYLIESFINITEHKRAEEEKIALQEQLRQSQKMEAIGSLAGGIAHDFNNLLTIIKGYSQLSLMELKEGDPLKPNIEEVQKAADRAAGLTRQILAFSRRQIMEMRVLDLNNVLQDLDKMLQRVIGEDVELVTLLAGELGRVRTDPGQIEQVIMNLAVNARDAMPHGGKLTIETANVELDEEYARRHIAVKPGHYVMLAVSDTGVGMAPEIRDRVFEPFFTTKDKSKGTGLGLSTVYGIVKQSGGNIWVYSEPNHGTTFKIYLPSVGEPLEELKEEMVRVEIHRGGETILLVEDEVEVRKLAVRVLERQGYTVLEARDGEEALLLCQHKKGAIHLILTDVVMPQMGGPDLVKQLRQARQDFKVLYMSGYTDNSITHHGVLEKGMNYIQKPFTIDGLMRKVREVLDK